MKFRTDLDTMVLAALTDGALHGYGIVRTIRNRSEGILKLGEGQLYPILHRLEQEGFIQGEWEVQEGRPPRRAYSLTEDGSKRLANNRKEWAAFSNAVANVLSEGRTKEVKGNA
jgi:PadR family transcriptional regulator PadR